jgi:hypothetical protein
VLAVLVATIVLGACGRSGVEATAGAASAATACEQLVGLEDTILSGQVNNAVANQALDSAKINADQAAAEDPRWKRLDGDVSGVLTDLVAQHAATLKSQLVDAAEICSPLSTTTATVP